jgi:hypothetical protein
MSRFALFSGYEYYPQGGWDDIEHVGTLDECKAAFDSDAGHKWAHIINLDTLKLIRCHVGKVAPWGADWEEAE